MKYRIFVQDVGETGFSAAGLLNDIEASSPHQAILIANLGRHWKPIALPLNRRDLWPDGKTGEVPAEALKYR